MKLIRTEFWEPKFTYGNRDFQMAILKFWPHENEGFAFISDGYTVKFIEPLYETAIQTQRWNVFCIWKTVFPIGTFENLTLKNVCYSLFQIATGWNSRTNVWNLIQTELWNVSFIWKPVFPIGIFEIYVRRKLWFSLYFSSLQD